MKLEALGFDGKPLEDIIVGMAFVVMMLDVIILCLMLFEVIIILGLITFDEMRFVVMTFAGFTLDVMCFEDIIFVMAFCGFTLDAMGFDVMIFVIAFPGRTL